MVEAEQPVKFTTEYKKYDARTVCAESILFYPRGNKLVKDQGMTTGYYVVDTMDNERYVIMEDVVAMIIPLTPKKSTPL